VPWFPDMQAARALARRCGWGAGARRRAEGSRSSETDAGQGSGDALEPLHHDVSARETEVARGRSSDTPEA
jgi:hypothetical protein